MPVTAAVPSARRERGAAWRTACQPTARAVDWAPMVGVAGLATAVMIHGLVTLDHVPAAGHIVRLRLAMAFLAAGAAFCLDDPAEPTTAASPMARSQRRSVRIALALIVWAAAWSVTLGLAGTAGGALPVRALTVEAIGWLAMAMAASAVAGGLAAGPSLLTAFVVMAQLPERFSFFAPPDGTWHDAHTRWVVVTSISVVVLIWTSRDPARRSL